MNEATANNELNVADLEVVAGDPSVPEVPRLPHASGAPDAARPWWRSLLGSVGVLVAIAAVPIGLLISWFAVFLNNCKLGLFGEYGLLPGAERINLFDLFGPLIGILVAGVPWAVIGRWGRHGWMRRAAWLVIVVVIALVNVVIYFPHLANPQRFLDGMCF